MNVSGTTVQNASDPRHRHVSVARSEDSPIEERTSHASERFARTRPRVPRVPVPVLVRLYVGCAAVGMHVPEPLVNLDRFVVRSEIDSRPKHLNDVIRLERLDGILDPVGIQERNVSVYPCDVLPILWKHFDTDVDEFLLHPHRRVRSVFDVLPHGKFGEWCRPDEFRHDDPYTLDVLNLMHKFDEQLLTSFESTIIKVWKDDVKNVLWSGTTPRCWTITCYRTQPHLLS